MASEQAKELASKQGVVRIGDQVPDFQQGSTFGDLDFYNEIDGKWAILFSHPRYKTPICTTELAAFARDFGEFEKLGVKVFALSVDTKEDNDLWVGDIAKFAGVEKVQFPIICDHDYKVSLLYGMVNQDHVDANSKLPFTVRSVYFISPDKKCMAIIAYPANVGRNFQEIIRVLKALQLTSSHVVATPVNWCEGKDCVIPPFVSTEEAQNKYGADNVDIVFPYLRFTKDPSAQ